MQSSRGPASRILLPAVPSRSGDAGCGRVGDGALGIFEPSIQRPQSSRSPRRRDFAFQPAGVRQAFAVSPDGSRLAFTAMGEDGQYRLWIRDLVSLEPREVPAARGAHTVFWSPGGDALYFGVNRSLRRVTPEPGSSTQIITDLSQACSASWHMDHARPHSPFVPSADRSGSRSRRSSDARSGCLPLAAGFAGRQALLYLVYDQRIERFRLRAGRFGDPKDGKDLLETDSRVIWVASADTPGASYLLYVRAGACWHSRSMWLRCG